MTFLNKDEFAKAIIDAGEDGLVRCAERDETRDDKVIVKFERRGSNYQFSFYNNDMYNSEMGGLWGDYNEEWKRVTPPVVRKPRKYDAVLAWDDEDVATKEVGVYCGENTIYAYDGIGGSGHFDQIHVIPNPRPWMLKMVKVCKERK